jgi:hypothetical protein
MTVGHWMSLERVTDYYDLSGHSSANPLSEQTFLFVNEFLNWTFVKEFMSFGC